MFLQISLKLAMHIFITNVLILYIFIVLYQYNLTHNINRNEYSELRSSDNDNWIPTFLKLLFVP